MIIYVILTDWYLYCW